MAKIDITQIEGYENMTPEEKVTALEGFEYNDNSAEVERYKNAVSKANGEAAEWKRKHNALLSDDQQKKQKDEEELNNLRSEVAELREDKLRSGHKVKLLALGYDEALATETAEAMVKGDTDKVFANQQKFLEAHDKNYRAELLKNSPRPPAGGNGGEPMTKEKLRAMNALDRHKFSQEHPEEYKQIYGGN